MPAEPAASPELACKTDSGILWRVAVATHAAGVLVPGALMFNTEGPAAGLGSGLNVIVAWWNIVAIVMFCAVQTVVLAAWRRCALSVRRATDLPAYTSERPGRQVLKGCAGLLFLAAWTAEAGYLVEAVTAVQRDGWHEPVSHLAAGLVAGAILTGALALITGATSLLAPIARGTWRKSSRGLAPTWDRPANGDHRHGAHIF